MKILLCGEYSGVHTNLAKALEIDGHQVDTYSDGDGWKSFKPTFNAPKEKSYGKFGIIINLFLELCGVKGLLTLIANYPVIKLFKNYDIVQIINPIIVPSFGSIGNLLFFVFLKIYNKKVFLTALGDDYYVQKLYFFGDMKYTPIIGFKLNNLPKYLDNIKYLIFPFHVLLCVIVAKKVNAIIPGLYDYKLAYSGLKNVTQIIPLPIIIDFELIDNKKKITNDDFILSIFHGVKPTKADEFKKGYNYFYDAVEIVKSKGYCVNYHKVSGLPYDDYLKCINESHIFFDQVLSYDRGMNAIIGMHLGKIVFSGNEDDLSNEYETTIPCINALPNAEYISEQLIHFIKNPELIEDFCIKARNYVLENHDARKVSLQYIKVWSSN
jgi:hypothetical protein